MAGEVTLNLIYKKIINTYPLLVKNKPIWMLVLLLFPQGCRGRKINYCAIIHKKCLSNVQNGDRKYMTADRLIERRLKSISEKETIDTDGTAGEFILTLFAALANMERKNILKC